MCGGKKWGSGQNRALCAGFSEDSVSDPAAPQVSRCRMGWKDLRSLGGLGGGGTGLGRRCPPPSEWAGKAWGLGAMQVGRDSGGRAPRVSGWMQELPGQMCGWERSIPTCSARAGPCTVKAQPLVPVKTGPWEKASSSSMLLTWLPTANPSGLSLAHFLHETLMPLKKNP